MDLNKQLSDYTGVRLGVIEDLSNKGIITQSTIRNYLIRSDFDNALKGEDYELIKHIFIDLSIKYNISDRQARRIVYDYMKKK